MRKVSAGFQPAPLFFREQPGQCPETGDCLGQYKLVTGASGRHWAHRGSVTSGESPSVTWQREGARSDCLRHGPLAAGARVSAVFSPFPHLGHAAFLVPDACGVFVQRTLKCPRSVEFGTLCSLGVFTVASAVVPLHWFELAFHGPWHRL